MEKCPLCEGKTTINVEDYRRFAKKDVCPVCNGEGKIKILLKGEDNDGKRVSQ